MNILQNSVEINKVYLIEEYSQSYASAEQENSSTLLQLQILHTGTA